MMACFRWPSSGVLLALILSQCLLDTNAWSGSLLSRRDVVETVVQQTLVASSLLDAPSSSVTNNVVVSSSAIDEERLALQNGGHIPRIGYSLYKTAAVEVPQCVKWALEAGIRHFDVASLYGTNLAANKVLQPYLYRGLVDDDDYEERMTQRQRRSNLFVAHKLSNEEQTKDKRLVRACVQKELNQLGVEYLDLVYLHSPLTSFIKRLNSYQALLEVQQQGLVRAVGVCNYSVQDLDELIEAGLPPPQVIQLALSPFNQHVDVVEWAEQHGSVLCCSAWSKLSSESGPKEGWAKLAALADKKGVTKQQVLIRWALQRGFVCVPRATTKDAIVENSYGAISTFELTTREMKLLNSLDEEFPVGKLKTTDGYSVEDISNDYWDPAMPNRGQDRQVAAMSSSRQGAGFSALKVETKVLKSSSDDEYDCQCLSSPKLIRETCACTVQDSSVAK